MNYYVYENTLDFSCSYMKKYGDFNMICQHYHSAYEILFMTDGVRYAFFNNGMHRITAGDIVIIKPYTIHFTENRDSNYFERYVLNFSDKVFQSVLSENECSELLSSLNTRLIHLEENNFIFVRKMFEELSKSKTKNRLSSKKTVSKIITLLDTIANMPSEESCVDKTDIICSGQIADVLNYINYHFTESLSLDFIVNYSHMSKANFCRIFKKETGNTFLQHLNNLRVAYAHSLLIETNMPIQKIADKAGFSSVMHFDRIFKNTHSMSPSEFRRQNR